MDLNFRCQCEELRYSLKRECVLHGLMKENARIRFQRKSEYSTIVQNNRRLVKTDDTILVENFNVTKNVKQLACRNGKLDACNTNIVWKQLVNRK